MIRAQDFSVCVAVYEKFYAWLANPDIAPGIVHDCSLVVVDELQILQAPERGEKLDLVLTLLRAQRGLSTKEHSLDHDLRVLGLAANREMVEPVRKWLQANHIHCDYRPVPLFRTAITAAGYSCIRSEGKTVHLIPDLPSLSTRLAPHQRLESLVLYYALVEDKRVLVFVPSKKYAQFLAQSLASIWGGETNPRQADKLLHLEDTHARRALRKTLPAAVAFHHGGMTTDERKLVERRFLDQEADDAVEVVISTPTLAMGVNLPADVVLILGASVYDSWDSSNIPASDEHKPPMRPLTAIEYRNMAGRAGRYRGCDGDQRYGLCILVQDENVTRDTIESLLDRACEPLTSALNHPAASYEPHIIAALSWLRQKVRIERDDLYRVFRGSFAYDVSDDTQRARILTAVDIALENMINQGFVHPRTLGLKGAASAGAGTGVRLSTLQLLDSLAPNVEHYLAHPVHLLHALAAAEDISDQYPSRLAFTRDQDKRERVVWRLTQLLQPAFEAETDLLASLDRAQSGDIEEVVRLVRAAALARWLEGWPATRIAESGCCPGLTRGDLHWLGDRVAWLIEVLALVWRGRYESQSDPLQVSRVVGGLTRLGRRVEYGVPLEVEDLADVRADGWNRDQIVNLSRLAASGTARRGRLKGSASVSPSIDALLHALRQKRMVRYRGQVRRRHVEWALQLEQHRDDGASAGWLSSLIENLYDDSAEGRPASLSSLMEAITVPVATEGIDVGNCTRLRFLDGTGLVAWVTLDANSAQEVYPFWESAVSSRSEGEQLEGLLTMEAMIEGVLSVIENSERLGRLKEILAQPRFLTTAEEVSLLLRFTLERRQQPAAKTQRPVAKAGKAHARPSGPKAEDLIKQALEQPMDVDFQLRAAKGLAQLKQLEQAVAFQSHAHALAPERLDVLGVLAYLMDQAGQHDQTEQLLWDEWARNPAHHLYPYYLAQHYNRIGKPDEAVAAYELSLEQAKQLLRTDGLGLAEIALIYEALASACLRIGDRSSAEKWAQEGISVVGDTKKLREVVAMATLTDEQWEGVQLGKVALGLATRPGKEEDALRAAEAATRLYPEHWRGYDARGLVLVRTGRVAEALEVWEVARTKDMPPSRRSSLGKQIHKYAASL